MSAFSLRPYRTADEAAVIALWQACGLTRPQNDPAKDIARKLRVNPEWFLVAEAPPHATAAGATGITGGEFGTIIGSVMAGYEGHRGWINYLAVAPAHQRGGLGRELMDAAERRLRAAGCPKINLQVRPENAGAIEFYRKIGFAVEGAVSLGKRLEHDDR